MKSDRAQVLLDVQRVDDPPVAHSTDHSFTTDSPAYGFSLDGYDPDDAQLAVHFLTLPSVGTILVQSNTPTPVQTNEIYSLDMTFVYQSPVSADCNAPMPTGSPFASFTWSLTDPSNLTSVATDTISICPGNQPPKPIGSARVGTIQDSTNGVAVVLGGIDPEGQNVIPVVLSLPQHGKLIAWYGVMTRPDVLPPVPSGGSNTITYIPILSSPPIDPTLAPAFPCLTASSGP